MIDYSAIRRDYKNDELNENNINPNPFQQFKKWFDEVISTELFPDPNAMVLSTVSSKGQPSSRVVLLKEFDEESFTYYTNYNSKKSKEIAENPSASLLFFWDKLERQIRIEGKFEKTNRNQSLAYFKSRPKESQIGALASNQSSNVSKLELEKKYLELSKQYEESEIPYPEYWGGYTLKPNYFEFWQGRPSRLHDRIAYKIGKDFKWEISRLSP